MLNSIFIPMGKYGPAHILTVLFFPLFAVASYFIFRKRSMKAKAIYLYVLMGIIFVATWGTFITDCITDYNGQRLNIWTRLPLQMCSINVMLYPLFFAIRNKVKPLIKDTLFAYMYFFGSIGAILAMVVTAPGDCIGKDVNLLRYNVLVYWIKHGLIFIIPILFVIFNFYKPRLIDTIKATVFLLILLTIMEGVNLLFSWFNHLHGGSAIANYFYTRTGKGTQVLETFYNLIPVELIYMLPLAFIAVPLFLLWYSPIGIINLIKKHKSK